MIRSFFRFVVLSALTLAVSACSTTNFMLAKWKDMNGPASQGQFKVGKPYNVAGRTYVPEESYSYDETGIASWYGPGFHGGRTANGEKYNQGELTAAHRTLQLPALVRVTNLENGRSVIVRVNDRGPFARGRIIDVSERAANLLDMKGHGTARVRVQVLAQESKTLADMARNGQSTQGYELALNGLSGGKSFPASLPSGAVDEGSQAPGFIQASAPVSPESRQVQVAALTTYNSNTPGVPGSERTVGMKPILDRDPMLSARTSSETARGKSPNTAYSLSGIPGHLRPDGQFYPDPVVKQFPVAPTALYVQVGSFSDPHNAQKVSTSLSALGGARVVPVQVGGRQYFRVQVGPTQSVDEADKLLSQIINHGFPEARIRVDQNSS